MCCHAGTRAVVVSRAQDVRQGHRMTTPTLATIHTTALARLVTTVALRIHREYRGTNASQRLFAEGLHVSTKAVLGNQKGAGESVCPHLRQVRRSASTAYAPRPFGIEQEMGKSMCVSEAAVCEAKVLVDHNKKPVIRLSDRNREDSGRQSRLGRTHAGRNQQLVKKADGPLSKC